MDETLRAMNTGMEIDCVTGFPRSQLVRTVAAAVSDTTILMLNHDDERESMPSWPPERKPLTQVKSQMHPVLPKSSVVPTKNGRP